MAEQAVTDAENAAFWSELCGSHMARVIGIEGEDPDALSRFDAHYFGYYPYLKSYVDRYDMRGRDVLEIGLGLGTLGQCIAVRGAVYHGLDIAPTPVEMMRHRLRLLGIPADDRVMQGSALDIPFPAETFDYVYSIGCLHHTGDLDGSLSAVHRVLRPGGTAVLMLYNRYSLRQLWRVDRQRLTGALRQRRDTKADTVRGYYDANASGEAAPHTDFVSKRAARQLLRRFSRVEVDAHNFDDVRLTARPLLRRELVITRERLLGSPVTRLLGLDLYITATK